MAESAHLKTEMETYSQHKDRLVAEHEGKYVLIHGEEIAGTWDTYEDALRVGYERFALAPFMVKRIQGIEHVQFLSRNVDPCPS